MEQKFIKANELLAEKSFLEELKKATSDEEVRDLFVKNGAFLELEDIQTMSKIACEHCARSSDELNEDELDSVAGGILITAGAAACFVVASTMLGFFTSYGYRTIKSWR